jgi:hypothetical protein
MLFPIHIGEKLDLSKFRRHALHYIANMQEITYHIYLPDFRMIVEIASPNNATGHVGSLWLEDITRDKDYEMISSKVIIPCIDTRFKKIKNIRSLFPNDHYKSSIESNSVADTVENICQIIKLISKINKLKVFL